VQTTNSLCPCVQSWRASWHCNGRLYVYRKARQSMLTKLWLPFSAAYFRSVRYN